MKQIFSILLTCILFLSCGKNKLNKEIKLFPVQSGEFYQYINNEGKVIINPQFKKANIFVDGLALVQTAGENPLWGYISEDGKFAIPAKYKDASNFSEGLAWVVSENSAPSVINTKGEILFTLKNAEKTSSFNDGLAAFSTLNKNNEELLGFVDKEGKVRIKPQFSLGNFFQEGKCAVKNRNGKWGFIDKEGKIVIDYLFDAAGWFINGKAIVSINTKFGAIDGFGKFIINPQYSDIWIDGENYLIKQDKKYGWCNANGEIIINPQFEEVLPFNGSNLAAVELDKKWGFINNEGQIVINPQFDRATSFNGKVAFVEIKINGGKKMGLINKEGKYIIYPQFKSNDNLGNIISLGYSENNHGVKTDYFNVEAIVNRINFNKPEGITLPDKLSNIMKKLDIAQNVFEDNTTLHNVFRDKKITKDISLSFYLNAQAFSKQTYYGNYFENIFNPDALVTTCYYFFESSDYSSSSKEGEIFDSLIKSLSGYTPVEIENYGTWYKNDKQLIQIQLRPDGLLVTITTEKTVDGIYLSYE